MILSLELVAIRYIWVLSFELSFILLIYAFLFFVTPCLVAAVRPCFVRIPIKIIIIITLTVNTRVGNTILTL